MGFNNSSIKDLEQDFILKVESIPRGFIIQRELIKALTGFDFFYNEKESGKPVRCVGVNDYEFAYYFRLWDDFSVFGLPHGRGSIAERDWLLVILKAFKRTKEITEDFKTEAMLKKERIKNGGHSITD